MGDLMRWMGTRQANCCGAYRDMEVLGVLGALRFRSFLLLHAVTHTPHQFITASRPFCKGSPSSAETSGRRDFWSRSTQYKCRTRCTPQPVTWTWEPSPEFVRGGA